MTPPDFATHYYSGRESFLNIAELTGEDLNAVLKSRPEAHWRLLRLCRMGVGR